MSDSFDFLHLTPTCDSALVVLRGKTPRRERMETLGVTRTKLSFSVSISLQGRNKSLTILIISDYILSSNTRII